MTNGTFVHSIRDSRQQPCGAECQENQQSLEVGNSVEQGHANEQDESGMNQDRNDQTERLGNRVRLRFRERQVPALSPYPLWKSYHRPGYEQRDRDRQEPRQPPSRRDSEK